MGLAAKKPCQKPGCPALVGSTDRFCEKHAKNNSKITQERNRQQEPHLRIYDTYRWRYKLRPMKLRNDPYCESGVICDVDNIGRRARATEVHHIKDTKQYPELAFVWRTSCPSATNATHMRRHGARKALQSQRLKLLRFVYAFACLVWVGHRQA